MGYMKPTVSSHELNRVEAILRDCIGEAHAISREALVFETKIPDRRIRATVHLLITERLLPVCSSPSHAGYYVAATQAEIDASVRVVRRHASEMFERAGALERCQPVTAQTAQLVLVDA